MRQFWIHAANASTLQSGYVDHNGNAGHPTRYIDRAIVGRRGTKIEMQLRDRGWTIELVPVVHETEK